MIVNTSPHKFVGIYNIATIVILKLPIADKQVAAMGIYIPLQDLKKYLTYIKSLFRVHIREISYLIKIFL